MASRATTATTTTAIKGLESLRAMHGKPGLSGTVRRKVYLPLHELRLGQATTREYLNDLGLNTLDADGQPVYEASTSAGLLVIPAQVLVLAILGQHNQFRRVLLRPWGPSYLMSAFSQPGKNSLDVLPTPHRMLSIQLEQPTMTPRLEWILTHPSATAAWCSVYRHALDGRFDMDMPRAFATASTIGHQVNDKFLITRLEIMELTPAEEPHPFAISSAKRSFVFNESVRRRPMHGRAAAPSRDERFSAHQLVTPLTDEQWLRVSPLITAAINPKGATRPGAPRTHAIRDVIDVIRLKLGTPYSWLKVPVDGKLAKTASAMLSKLNRGGAWDEVVASMQVR